MGDLIPCLQELVADFPVEKVFSIRSRPDLVAKRENCKNVSEADKVKQECEIVRQNPHPNVCEYVGSVRQDKAEGGFYVYLFMKRMPRDLAQELARRNSLNPKSYFEEDLLWKITRELVSVFAFLQEKVRIMQNIAHRDVKPQNILIDDNNEVKVCDFGWAKIIVPEMGPIQTVAGTIMYFSPNLYKAYVNYGDNCMEKVKHNVYKSDVYSLGITLLLMSTLEMPKFEDAINKIRLAILNAVSNLGRYSESWRNLITRMLTKDEEDRPDFLELAAELNGGAVPTHLPEFPDDIQPAQNQIPPSTTELLVVTGHCGLSHVRVCKTDFEEVPCMITLKAAEIDLSHVNDQRGGADVVCVIDVSSSMILERMNLVKRTFRKLVSILQPFDRMSIVTFNTVATRICPLTPCDDQGKASLSEHIGRLVGSGCTNISAGFLTGLSVINDRVNPNSSAYLLLFSDGENNTGPDPVSTTLEALLIKPSDRRPLVHIFGYSNEVNVNTLKTIADEGKGQFHSVNNAQELETALADVAGDIITVVARDISVSVSVSDSRRVTCTIPKIFTKDGSPSFSLPFITANAVKNLMFILRPALQDLAQPVTSYPISLDVSYKGRDGRMICGQPVNIKIDFVPWKGAPRPQHIPGVYVHLYRVIGADCLEQARKFAETGDFGSAGRKVSFGKMTLMESGFQENEVVAAILGDLNRMEETVRSKGNWDQGGSHLFTSLSYSHMNQCATVGTDQYMTPQQTSLKKRFTEPEESQQLNKK